VGPYALLLRDVSEPVPNGLVRAAQRESRAVSAPRLTGTRWAPREASASASENASTVVPARSRAALSPVTPGPAKPRDAGDPPHLGRPSLS
jgi:hypothetical protein